MRWSEDHPFDRGLYTERVDTPAYVEALEARVESQAAYIAQLASELLRGRARYEALRADRLR